jgi:hypothetical protein
MYPEQSIFPTKKPMNNIIIIYLQVKIERNSNAIVIYPIARAI